ncbi:MAG: N(4)-(beta-N-acetylglucosaminyl)-L-asparaginase [Firmicutes bacterium]|nr:N(4)-(beta-N-acetylglucosaminyl)-L-asparaginase [Bacillota bacterium]
MKPIVIATWDFARAAIPAGGAVLEKGGCAADAVVETIIRIEDNPDIESVGFGGIPNIRGEMELDAAMMRGRDLRIGAVMGLSGFKNPIKVARDLVNENYNNVLCGQGAADYALEKGHQQAIMLTDASRKRWEEAMAVGQTKPVGHDTVGCLALDHTGQMVAGVSTAGLGFKHRGRVGDSPLVGSGFYVDNEVGGAAATGVGEDIMKGCVCFAAVEAMRSGLTPQAAVERAVEIHTRRMRRSGDVCGKFAMIAIDKEGHYGGACCCEFEYSLWQDGKIVTVTPVEIER